MATGGKISLMMRYAVARGFLARFSTPITHHVPLFLSAKELCNLSIARLGFKCSVSSVVIKSDLRDPVNQFRF